MCNAFFLSFFSKLLLLPYGPYHILYTLFIRINGGLTRVFAKRLICIMLVLDFDIFHDHQSWYAILFFDSRSHAFYADYYNIYFDVYIYVFIYMYIYNDI